VVVSGLSERDYQLRQPGFVRAVDIRSGVRLWQKTGPARVGSAHSYVVGNLLVDSVSGTQVLDLKNLDLLWSSPAGLLCPLVGDDELVVEADGGIVCREVRSGRVRWSRTASEVGGGAHGLGCIWNEAFIVRGVGDAKALTALDLSRGGRVWEAPGYPLMWWHPYDGHAYGFTIDGRYVVIDLLNGQVALEKLVSPRVPVAAVGDKPAGRRFQAELGSPPRWQNATLAVSETHAFIMNESGQLVILGRESGAIEQIVEIDGKPMAQAEPVIYMGHLLLTDFDAAVYCFKGE
jgi:outer membrane protein assembly factor BamB